MVRDLIPRQNKSLFLFSEATKPAFEVHQPPIQQEAGAPSSGLKRSELEGEYSALCIAEVTNEWSYAATPTTARTGIL